MISGHNKNIETKVKKELEVHRFKASTSPLPVSP